jgi:hypothetical protein
MRALSNDCRAGGSIAGIAGRHAIANAATALPANSTPITFPTIRPFVIRPDAFLKSLLAQIRGPQRPIIWWPPVQLLPN